VTKDAEDAWLELLLTGAGRMLGSPDCTPGYYNNEGRDPGPSRAFFALGYPQGAMAFFRYIDEWRSSGEFEGLDFGRVAGGTSS
jgi:cyclohexanone monooxygenase